MGILVAQLALGEERARLRERLDDGAVGVAFLAVLGDDALAGEERHLGIKGAILAHRARHFEIVLAPELVVVLAMPRGDMHEARARLRIDEMRQEAQEHKSRSKFWLLRSCP